jgi:hypothetical protein
MEKKKQDLREEDPTQYYALETGENLSIEQIVAEIVLEIPLMGMRKGVLWFFS